VEKSVRHLAAVFLWAVIIIGMAVLDVASPGNAFRAAEWLAGFGLCILVAIQVLEPDRTLANGLTLVFVGLLLFVYDMVWWIANDIGGAGLPTSIILYPFGVTANLALWLTMLAVGALLLWMGLEPMVRKK
jgi:hypothetical protein